MLVSSCPERAHRVNDGLGRQLVGPGQFGFSDFAAAQQATFVKQIRSGGSMDRAIDTASAQE